GGARWGLPACGSRAPAGGRWRRFDGLDPQARIGEPTIVEKCLVLSSPPQHGRRAARLVLSWSGWIDFRTIQVCPKDLASAVRQSERAANRPNGPVRALIAIGEEVPDARHDGARVHCSGRCG